MSIIAIAISIWAISISNRTEKELNWLNDKQDNVIESLLFKKIDLNNDIKIKNNENGNGRKQ